jgi:2-polyprenyl-3-methyl-5-hydroxy-6-metoxy-1,4-benzoquinol methylase
MAVNHNVFKEDHVCPWWMAYSFDNPLRRLFHKPRKLLAPYVQKDMTVMDVGCGMGYFSIALAKMVGDGGRVIAVDLQQKMLNITLKRAKRAGVAHRIQPHLCGPKDIGLNGQVDFVLTFWMVHEVPDRIDFFRQLASNMTQKGRLFVAEPKFHVSQSTFQDIIGAAQATGLLANAAPAVRFSHSAIFIKP